MMIKKILIAIFVVLLFPISAQAYGWTTEACKTAGCGCEATSVEGKCNMIGNCSKCKTPVCQTRPSAIGSVCYLVDKAECNEVYEIYKDYNISGVNSPVQVHMDCTLACKDYIEKWVNACRADTTGKGDYYSLNDGGCCKEEVNQIIFGKTVNIKGDGLPDVPILINCDPVKVSQTKFVSDSTGDFEISVQAEKDKKIFCKMIIGSEKHIRVTLTKVSPGNLGEIKIGAVAEYELNMKTSIMQMLMDSGISKEDAVAYVAYINFKYTEGNPSFQEVTPSYITGKIYGANYEISMDPKQYLTDRETLYHEMTHAIVQKMFPDVVPASPSHDIYEKLSATGAFDEGRAHFFAYLMLKKTGEYDATKDQFQDDKVIEAITNNKIDIKGGEGNSVEASVTAFLKDYYVNISPEDAWKDYMKTVNGCKTSLGHTCQTINEFIKQKGFLENGAFADAAKLGIKIEKDSTCVIKKGSSYKPIDSGNIQLDSGDIECGSRDVRVNDIQIMHGGTQYVVSKAGDTMSISVLEGTVKATNVTNKENVDISAGNKVAYNSSVAKFSSPEKIDIQNIEKFWELDTQKKTSSSKFPYSVLAVVFVLGGIGVALLVRKFTKKSA